MAQLRSWAEGRNLMGFTSWLARRKVRGIVKAMWKHYNEGRTLYSDRDLATLCCDVIHSRYQTLEPSDSERVVLQRGMDYVHDFCDAAILVAVAESKLTIRDIDLYSTLVQTTVAEVTRLQGSKGPDEEIDEFGSKSEEWIERFTEIYCW